MRDDIFRPPVTLAREALYNKVWSTPLRRLVRRAQA